MVRCCAYECKSCSERKDAGITFHRFPKDPETGAVWVKNMRIANWQPTVNDRICSLHFEEDCFYKTAQKTRLHKGAVPTKFSEMPVYLQPKKVNSKSNRDTESTNEKLSTTQSKGREIEATAEEHIIHCKEKNSELSTIFNPNCSDFIKVQPQANFLRTLMDAELPGKYSLENLIDDWRSSDPDEVPPHWEMVELGDGVLFWCVDFPEEPTVTLCVKEDMSVEIKIDARTVKYPILSKVERYQDLLLAIEKIASLRICANSKCSYGFYIHTPKSRRVMCRPCAVFNRKRKNCEIKQKTRLLERLEKRGKPTKKDLTQKYNNWFKIVKVQFKNEINDNVQ